MRKIISFIFLALATYAIASPRLQYSINEDWTFFLPNQAPTQVSLPHTWNTIDALDDEPGYTRTKAIYSQVKKIQPQRAMRLLYASGIARWAIGDSMAL